MGIKLCHKSDCLVPDLLQSSDCWFLVVDRLQELVTFARGEALVTERVDRMLIVLIFDGDLKYIHPVRCGSAKANRRSSGPTEA